MTRQAVIDAIQRFAAANGRPPKVDDWRGADRDRSYPPPGCVYRSSSYRNAPFGSWNEALIEAGFTPHEIKTTYTRWTREKLAAEIAAHSKDGKAPGHQAARSPLLSPAHREHHPFRLVEGGV